MSENMIDCRGLSCPLPVIWVKDRVEQTRGAFAVLVDTGVAVENITRFLGQRGISCAVSPRQDGTLIQIMEKS